MLDSVYFELNLGAIPTHSSETENAETLSLTSSA